MSALNKLDDRRSRIGRRSRRKGHNFEREIVRHLRAAGYDAERGWWQSGPRGGTLTPDVITPGWWVECSTGARPDMPKKLAQAEANVSRARSDARPVAIVRRKGERTIRVALRLPSGPLEGVVVDLTFGAWVNYAIPRMAR